MLIRRIICTIALNGLIALNSSASDVAPARQTEEDYQNGRALLWKPREGGDVNRGLEQLRKAANAGHIKAQTELGIAYAQGKGVMIDNVIAFQWFEKAAVAGDVVAQTNLG